MQKKSEKVKLTEAKLKQLIRETIEEELGGPGANNINAEEIVSFKRHWAELIGQVIMNVKDPQNNGSNLTQNPGVRPIYQTLVRAYQLCGDNPPKLGM